MATSCATACSAGVRPDSAGTASGPASPSPGSGTARLANGAAASSQGEASTAAATSSRAAQLPAQPVNVCAPELFGHRAIIQRCTAGVVGKTAGARGGTTPGPRRPTESGHISRAQAAQADPVGPVVAHPETQPSLA
jgi:hypothetical protein